MEPIDIEDLYIRAGTWTATQMVKPLNALMMHLLRVKEDRANRQQAPNKEPQSLENTLTASAKLAAALPIHGRTVKIEAANDTPEQAAIMDAFGDDAFLPATYDSNTPAFVPVVDTNTARTTKPTGIRRSTAQETKKPKKTAAKTKKPKKSKNDNTTN